MVALHLNHHAAAATLHGASSDESCGFPGWPDLAAGTPCLSRFPDGTDVPDIAVLVLGEGGPPRGTLKESVEPRPPGREATLQSIVGQGYPRLETLWVAAAPPAPSDALGDAIRATAAEFVLVLRMGDMLAPGALAALALAAWREGADAVAGLRVVYGRSIGYLDTLSPRIGMSWGADPGPAPIASRAWVFGGDVLVSTRALARADAFPSEETGPNLAISSRLRLARIGRPVLLRYEAATVTPKRKALRVAALNDTGPAGGGAGIAHRRLIEALRCGGHEVTIHALNREVPPAAAEWTESFPDTEAAIREAAPDLVLVGNIHGATRTSTILGRLAAVAPVAAVLHDLFLLTGRCAHPGGASRIVTGCDALCPRPDLYPQLARGRIAGVFAQKRAVLSGPDAPVLIAASDWAAARARDLGPTGVKVARIDLAFPTQVFRPGDKRALRRRLGLSDGDFLILFVAVIADQPDKGGADLMQALARVAGPGIGFVALGRIDAPGSFPLPNLVAPGPITDEEDLARWYGACDLHVTASRLETLGQTPIEAGLCGVPTVAYRATGLTTAVIDGVSGLLVDPEPAALAEAIASLIADPERLRALSLWGRIAIESRNSHAAAYLGLHDVLVDMGLASSQGDRIVFTAETLGTFAGAAAPWPGARGTVKRSPHPVIRLARRAKQRLWGRAQPLWMRRGVYLAARMRRAARGVFGKG